MIYEGMSEAKAVIWVIYWRWGTKAWGANRIWYPGSPCCQRWMLMLGNFPA